MTRSQPLAALMVGAILLVGIPVAGSRRESPPDLGDPVVVGRTGPGSSRDWPSGGGEGHGHVPERTASAGPSADPTAAPSDTGVPEPSPTGAAPEPDRGEPDRPTTAQPVSPKPPPRAGAAPAEDPAPTRGSASSPTAAAPSGPAGDDEGDDDGDGDGVSSDD